MKKSKFNETKILAILKEAEAGMTVATQFSATANPAALSISISIEGNGINRSNVLDSASSRPMSSSSQRLKITGSTPIKLVDFSRFCMQNLGVYRFTASGK